MTRAAIESAIPHREPFLLVDEVVEQSDRRILCRKRFTGGEFWYRGHYPAFPVTPGVLLCEAAMQAGAVLLASRAGRDDESEHEVGGETGVSLPQSNVATSTSGMDEVPVVTRMNNVKFKTMVRPGDTIEMEVGLTEQIAGAFFMNAKVSVDGKTAVTFDFACKMVKT
jgi:3-hydroxyacyl-[acyl-carrier-protein] dehydratase